MIKTVTKEEFTIAMKNAVGAHVLLDYNTTVLNFIKKAVSLKWPGPNSVAGNLITDNDGKILAGVLSLVWKSTIPIAYMFTLEVVTSRTVLTVSILHDSYSNYVHNIKSIDDIGEPWIYTSG